MLSACHQQNSPQLPDRVLDEIHGAQQRQADLVIATDPDAIAHAALTVLGKFDLTRPVRLLGVRADLQLDESGAGQATGLHHPPGRALNHLFRPGFDGDSEA